jgi:hypothetical protein
MEKVHFFGNLSALLVLGSFYSLLVSTAVHELGHLFALLRATSGEIELSLVESKSPFAFHIGRVSVRIGNPFSKKSSNLGGRCQWRDDVTLKKIRYVALAGPLADLAAAVIAAIVALLVSNVWLQASFAMLAIVCTVSATHNLLASRPREQLCDGQTARTALAAMNLITTSGDVTELTPALRKPYEDLWTRLCDEPLRKHTPLALLRTPASTLAWRKHEQLAHVTGAVAAIGFHCRRAEPEHVPIERGDRRLAGVRSDLMNDRDRFIAALAAAVADLVPELRSRSSPESILFADCVFVRSLFTVGWLSLLGVERAHYAFEFGRTASDVLDAFGAYPRAPAAAAVE